MEHVDVLHVFANVRALDVEVVQIVKRHDGDIAIELHHERDELLLPDEIGHDARLALRQREHLIVRIARDVVDMRVGIIQQPLDGALEITVEPASLG